MNVREIAGSERDYWDLGIQRLEAVHPLNAYAWGEIRAVDEWVPRYLVAERGGRMVGGMMVLEKRLPFTPLHILYSPKGPVWDYQDVDALKGLIGKAMELGRQRKAIFLRVDPNLREEYVQERNDLLCELGFRHLEQRWTPWNSPRDVSRIDLTQVKDAEELLSRLDRDTRRCIRKASREGVSIEIGSTEDDLEKFYNIFKEFSVSKRFLSRDYNYQRKLWETYVVPGRGRLFLAKYQGEVIGGLVCIMFGKKCLAMHMGTPYKYHKLQTYYAYVWESIKWAKEEGCTWYSFRGVGSTPTQEYFKNKFLPECVHLVGYYDLPLRSTLYQLLYNAEFHVLPKTLRVILRARNLWSGTRGVLTSLLQRKRQKDKD